MAVDDKDYADNNATGSLFCGAFMVLTPHNVYIHIRVGVFSRGSKHLYALRSSVVVPRAGHAEYERFLRNHGLR